MLKRMKSRKELEGIWEMINRESSIDKSVGIFNDRVKALFDRIFPEVEKRITVRHNVDNEAKQLHIKCRKYEKKWLKIKKDGGCGSLQADQERLSQ